MGNLGFEYDNEVDSMIINDDLLICPLNHFDLIIGNPPYVRHERIPINKKSAYRKLFGTFRHRSDLYIAFFEKSLRHLSSGGELCFICPDRWMLNTFGQDLRNLLSEEFI